MTSVPSEIGDLRKLRYLSVERNQLTHLPSTIGQLTNLTEQIWSITAFLMQKKNGLKVYYRIVRLCFKHPLSIKKHNNIIQTPVKNQRESISEYLQKDEEPINQHQGLQYNRLPPQLREQGIYHLLGLDRLLWQ